MATRYGKPVDLWAEVILYLRGLSFGSSLSQWTLRDFLDGCRGNQFTQEEFQTIVDTLQNTYGCILPEGSLRDSMHSVSTDALTLREKLKMGREIDGFLHMSKLDELVLLRRNGSSQDI